MPGESLERRMDILQVLVRRLEKTTNFRLQEKDENGLDPICVLAEKTEGLTGADLQALLYTVQLNKCHNNSSRISNMSKTQTQQQDLIVITLEDLLAALQQTRMSVSPSELLKYSTIYQKFRRKITGKNEDSSYTDKENFFKAGSKSTLA